MLKLIFLAFLPITLWAGSYLGDFHFSQDITATTPHTNIVFVREAVPTPVTSPSLEKEIAYLKNKISRIETKQHSVFYLNKASLYEFLASSYSSGYLLWTIVIFFSLVVIGALTIYRFKKEGSAVNSNDYPMGAHSRAYSVAIHNFETSLAEIKRFVESQLISLVSSFETLSRRFSSIEKNYHDQSCVITDLKTELGNTKNTALQNTVDYNTLLKFKSDFENIKSETMESLHSFENFFYSKLNSLPAQAENYNNKEADNSVTDSLDQLGQQVEFLAKHVETFTVLQDELFEKAGVSARKIKYLEEFFNRLNIEINSVINELIDNNVDLTKKIVDIHSRIVTTEQTKKVA